MNNKVFPQLKAEDITISIHDWLMFHEDGSTITIVKSEGLSALVSGEDGSILVISN